MDSWLQRILMRLSLRKVNFYTIVFILFFTMIFASLLIFNEYQAFSQTQNVQTDQTLKSNLIKIMVEIATLALIIFGGVVAISKIVNAMIMRDMERFLQFFGSILTSKQCVLPNDLYFDEFKTMARYANDMAETLYAQQAELHALNSTLEEKVREKTAYSDALLAAQQQFIRYAIHETHTPLAVMMANIELFGLKEGRNRYLAKIEAAAKNIFTIYDDLGYLVKKTKLSYPKRPIEMVSYINARLDFFYEVAHNAHVRFEFVHETAACTLLFNETKLQRIIDNNLANAIKYAQKKSVVRVRLDDDGQTLRWSVTTRSKRIVDTEMIFQAYYRERQKSDGFGLGLTLVKEICDEENVAISLTSNDETTTFCYTFPKEAHENFTA